MPDPSAVLNAMRAVGRPAAAREIAAEVHRIPVEQAVRRGLSIEVARQLRRMEAQGQVAHGPHADWRVKRSVYWLK